MFAIDCDAQEIVARISTSGISAANVERLRQQVSELSSLAQNGVKAGPVMSSRLPLSSAHQDMYGMAAEAERTAGASPLSAWVADSWGPLGPLDRPTGDETSTLSTATMRDEQRAVAFNLRSTSSHAQNLRVHIAIAGLPPDSLQLYKVNWTGADNSRWVAAELELLGDASAVREVSVLPGVTQQLWIDIHPRSPTPPQQYGGFVFVDADDGTRVSLPIDITVFKTQFPERVAAHFGGWDYADGSGGYAVTEANRAQLIDHLQQRYVDTPWAQRGVMHWDNLDAEGNISTPLDATAMERWVAEWTMARRFRVFLGVEDNIAGIPVTDSRFAHAVANWARAWAAEIARLNKSAEQFDLLLVDEPQSAAQARTTELWANAIRGSGAGFRIWTDPTWRDPYQTPQNLIDAADTISVNLNIALQSGDAYANWARGLREQGKALEIYACEGPARRLDPYAYYRLAAWQAFSIGALSVSLWSFSDTRGSPADNEFASAERNYSPLFINNDGIRPGKQMEAAVEGIQDYQYLSMLSDVAARHADEATRSRARELLDSAMSRVLGSPRLPNFEWQAVRERNEADLQRIQIGAFLDSTLP